MAYDEGLAARIRRVLDGRDGVQEKKMFGCLAFTLHGNLACGVNGDELMVRLGPAGAEKALDDPHARSFAMGERAMKGWVLVDADGHGNARSLRRWVDQGFTYAATFPPK